jgi:hypothetical protein
MAMASTAWRAFCEENCGDSMRMGPEARNIEFAQMWEELGPRGQSEWMANQKEGWVLAREMEEIEADEEAEMEEALEEFEAGEEDEVDDK